MKLLNTWTLLSFACGWALVADAQLQLVPDQQPQSIFCGAGKNIYLTLHNPGDQNFANNIRARIFQTSSATAVQVGETSWKKLEVLPQQTVIESARLDFPEMKTETKFLVQWLENSNSVIGRTEVLVYPINLLAELKPLAGSETLGVFDPQNQLKPLLKNLKLDFADLENSGLENFSGKLAIIGPFQPKTQIREGLARQIKALAKKGAAIVWLQPPRGRVEKLQPSFYSVPESTNAVVIVQPDLVFDLPENPQAQLNLIYFCKLALNPQPMILPDLSPQP